MRKKLKDICTFISGNAWKSSEFSDDEGIPIIRINNLNPFETEFKYWKGDYDKKYLINEGDLLVSLSGTIKTFQWQGPEGLLNQRIVKVTANEDTNQDWVYYQISHVIEQIADKGKHAVIKNVSVNDLKNFEVEIPDIQSQNQIVGVLDLANSIIKRRIESFDLLDELLRCSFLEMFGDPVFNKKGWRLLSLKEVVKKIDAGWSPVCEEGSRVNSDQWAVLKQGAVSKRKFNPQENKKLPEDTEIKKNIQARKGDLLFSRKNTKEYVGATAFVFEEFYKLLLPDTIFNIRYDNNKVSPLYLLHLFNDRNFRIKIQNLRTGAAGSMPNISQKNLLDLEIPVPDKSIQNRFEEVALNIYSKKSKIEDSHKQSVDLFNSIMQRAFSGQLKFDVAAELDALIEQIDLNKAKNDLIGIETNEEYLTSLVERLNSQDFLSQELYDKAKHAAFQLLKEGTRLDQEYSESGQSLKLVVK